MIQYDNLKEELLNIAVVLEKYPEGLRQRVFEILVASFTKGSISETSDAVLVEDFENDSEIQKKKEGLKKTKTTTSKKAVSESYSIDRNLNLRGGEGILSFKDFYNEKKPQSKSEFNAIAIYYLKNLMALPSVTLNHAYTCYKEAGLKPAEHFKQSFIDTKNKQGYIEYDENWNLLIPHRGVTFVEHDLPRAIISKK